MIIGILTSLVNERLLNLLCGDISNPALNRALEESKEDSKFLIRSERVHYVEQYIMDHHVDGSVVVAKGTRPTIVAGARESAKKAFLNMRKTLAPKHPTGQVKVPAASERSSGSSRRSGKARSGPQGVNRRSRSLNKDIKMDEFMQRFLAVPQPHREQAWKLVCGTTSQESVSLKGIRFAVEELFIKRRNLANALRSSKKVISSLNYVLLGLFAVIEVMVAVAIFGSLDNLA